MKRGKMREFIMYIDWILLGRVVVRLGLAVIMGSIIGNERAKHRQSAGLRTHLLVCLGSALTALISVYLYEVEGSAGDMTRISAQVISGIGFLGAGMIMIKPNNMIKGLTTAAGVWTTSIIGIALGYGFYYGAIVAFVFFLSAIIYFTKLEDGRNSKLSVYVEIDDMSSTNKIIKEMQEMFGESFSYQIISARSGNVEHLGIDLVIDKNLMHDATSLCEIDHVIYVDEA